MSFSIHSDAPLTLIGDPRGRGVADGQPGCDHGGRYTHAYQFKRARRALRFLPTRLGRVIRDIRRKIEGDPALDGTLRSAARISPTGSAIRSPPARAQDLFPACARGRTHRQRQGPRALRVRLQGLHRHTRHRPHKVYSRPRASPSLDSHSHDSCHRPTGPTSSLPSGLSPYASRANYRAIALCSNGRAKSSSQAAIVL